ncbi:MAG: serine--tRNA ligase, partial [Lentisphaerae bacterium]
MIDIKILRENPELVRENCQRRGVHNVDVDRLHAMDQEYLELLQETERLRRTRNELSARCKTDPEARSQVKALKQQLSDLENKAKALKCQIDEQLAWLPNFLAPDVPPGESDEDNQEIRRWGEQPQFAFKPRDHQELGELLGIIDTARGAKVAQAGFYYWQGKGAILAQALFFWAQQELVKRGFTLYMSPCVAKEKTLFGTGYLPFFADQTYKIENEDLALIGTSE